MAAVLLCTVMPYTVMPCTAVGAAQPPRPEHPSAAHTVAASRLRAARAAYLDAKFEESLSLFQRALRADDIDVGGLVEGHRYLSALNLLAGRAVRAQAHARAALVLNIDAEPPEGASASLAEIFDAARPRSALRLELERVEAQAGEHLRVRLTAMPAKGALALTLRLRCAAGDADVIEQASEQSRVSLGLESGASTVHCRGLASSEGGTVVRSIHREFRIGDEEEVTHAVGAAGSRPRGRGAGPSTAVRSATRPSAGEGSDEALWIGLGIGAGALAAAAVALAVAIVVSSSQGQAEVGAARVPAWE